MHGLEIGPLTSTHSFVLATIIFTIAKHIQYYSPSYFAEDILMICWEKNGHTLTTHQPYNH